MLLFPNTPSEQKISPEFHGNCGFITIRSQIPADKKIVLQGGSETTPLSDCPEIGLHVSEPDSYEWMRLMDCVCIIYDHGADITEWLPEFSVDRDRIMRGTHELWKLKRVEIGLEDIILRYSDGKRSGDVILEDFCGAIDFTIPTRWRSECIRTVTMQVDADKSGRHIIRIDSHLPNVLRDNVDSLRYYDSCSSVSLTLTHKKDDEMQLKRWYLFEKLDERAHYVFSNHTLRYLLGCDAAADEYLAIGL